jgi:hypothetical protein
MAVVEEARKTVGLLDDIRELNVAAQEQRTWAENQLARFNLWTESLGVFAHGTFSIEHRLAENDQVKGVVYQLLAALSANLEHCTYFTYCDDDGR